MGSLIHCLELAINLKLVSYARGRNRKPLPWRRHGICSFFMFLTWTALLTNFTFGKGESQTANHFFILRFTYEYNFICISLLFYFTDAKRIKVTTTSWSFCIVRKHILTALNLIWKIIFAREQYWHMVKNSYNFFVVY